MNKIDFPVNDFDYFLIDSVKKSNKSLVFVDGEDMRTVIALKELKKFNPGKTVLLGSKKVIENNLNKISFRSDDIQIIEPAESEKLEEYAILLQGIFYKKNKSITKDEAIEIVKNNNFYATLMAKVKDIDGGVSGSISSTEDMIRPLIQIIGTGYPKRYISGACVQIIPDSHYGQDGKFLFADVAIIPEPDQRQMIDIVLASYQTARALLNCEPRIAMLSYSTKGSAGGARIDVINKVIEEIRTIDPDIKIDGELQFDAAVVPEVARLKNVKSEVAGKANVLIFPNLDAANICIKAIHHLANSFYYGTIIQGPTIPFNDLSRGCDPVEILTISLITLVQLSIKDDKH